MNAETVVTNIAISVVTGVITGLAAAYFGFRSAVGQFKSGRAFDRQLDWYEQTSQAIIELLRLNATYIFAINHNRPDLLKELNMTPAAEELQKAVNTAVLYCNRELYIRLKEVAKNLRELLESASRELSSETPTPEAYTRHVKLLEQTLFELSKPMRNMLGLGTLGMADFEK